MLIGVHLQLFDSAIGFKNSIAVEKNLRMASFLGENAAQCEAKEPPENASGENVFFFLNNLQQNIFNFLNIQQIHFRLQQEPVLYDLL